jgi:hypothetical protein
MGFRLFKSRNGDLACDCRKIVKERVQRLTALEVVDHCLDRYARADQYGSAAQDIRIGAYDGRLFDRRGLVRPANAPERDKWWAL